ncbi:MAG TPA: PDZ domain-containing protein, partial [Ilumatobacteraceae bacterium]|nr:PDZ domain-containing protein [Ilumatobacteraceae bacterium]
MVPPADAPTVSSTAGSPTPGSPTEVPPALAPRSGHRFWAGPLAGVALLALTAMVLATFFTASRFTSVVRPYAIVPSDAEPVQSHLDVEGADTYPTDGSIRFVTIRQPQLSLLSWLLFRDAEQVVPRTYVEVYGVSTPQQVRVRGRRQMFNAQQAAEYVALSKLGFPVERSPGAVVVDQIVCFKASDDGRSCIDQAPSGKVLQPDDEIVSVDGHEIETIDDLLPVLAGHQGGDMVEVRYIRAGEDTPRTDQIELLETGAGTEDDPKRVIIGFYPFDTTTISSSPFPIEFDLAGVGGPSAGLAFTLTLIDVLTPGSLTGGHEVAVTGEINV